jgi:PhzF family phenazine biosynthesis protein
MSGQLREDKMGVQIYQVDAFTAEPFAGNPAGVCILEAPREDGWMLEVAAEMNLSETAFLRRRGREFDLRWFTPAVEVDLCGHATLASAHVLWETGILDARATARFETRSGLLTATRRNAEIELDFPATPDAPAEAPPGLIAALGVEPDYVGKSAFDYLVHVASENEVLAAAPDFARLGRLTARGVIVTSAASRAGYDFVSRFFAPAVGIDEDPVTGSAHCCLGPFWSRRLGKAELMAYQASTRGGTIRVTVAGDRVRLGGRAVTILRGELAV